MGKEGKKKNKKKKTPPPFLKKGKKGEKKKKKKKKKISLPTLPEDFFHVTWNTGIFFFLALCKN